MPRPTTVPFPSVLNSVAQWIAYQTSNLGVAGSSPVGVVGDGNNAGPKFALCVLRPGVTDHAQIDLLIGTGNETVKFSVTGGSAKVHITGYEVLEETYDGFGDDDDSDDDEDDDEFGEVPGGDDDDSDDDDDDDEDMGGGQPSFFNFGGAADDDDSDDDSSDEDEAPPPPPPPPKSSEKKRKGSQDSGSGKKKKKGKKGKK
jgi:hypothetical protein